MLKTLFYFRNIILTSCIVAMNSTVGAQTVDWVKGMGGSSSEYGDAMAVDGEGNVYVTGYFASASADFNPGSTGGTLSTTGNYDIFLSKYDPTGNLIWAKSMGGSNIDYAFAIALDGRGNLFLTGMFTSSRIDFNPGGSGGVLTNNGGYEAYVAKLDTSGNFVWAKGVGGSDNDVGYALDVDGNGDVYVTGYFKSPTIDFNPGGTGGTVFNLGQVDVFLVKYSSGGNFRWAKGLGGNNSDLGYALALDGNGSLYISGTFISTAANFNPGGTGGILNSAGGNDAFLAKYDTAGNFVWAKAMGGGDVDFSYSIAIDPAGNVFTTGYFSSATADFNPGGTGGILRTSGVDDVFLAKYDAGGNLIWIKSMGGSESDIARSVAVDGAGNAYVAGRFYSETADFNAGGSGGSLTNMDPGGGKGGTSDVFLGKYDPAGNFLWAKAMGGNDEDEARSVTVDRSGNAYITGYFNSTIADFDRGGSGGTLTNRSVGGGSDVFLVKFVCTDTTSTHVIETLHCGQNYILTDSVYSVSGIYTHAFPKPSGCDSSVILNLTVIPLDKPAIHVNEFLLSTSTTYATYQWIRNDTLIQGATADQHQVTSNGNYRVAVSNEYGCTDTSDVYSVTNVSVRKHQATVDQIRIFPNPAGSAVHIQSPIEVKIGITDISGRILSSPTNAASVDISLLGAGSYLLHVSDEHGHPLKVEKLIKIK